MTPQELKLLDELFDRLESLESGPRDPDAVSYTHLTLPTILRV